MFYRVGKAIKRWPTDVWQNLKRGCVVKIGGESSDQILTFRNLGGAETFMSSEWESGPDITTAIGGFFVFL